MRLKPSSCLILGMLNLGLETGYAVKRTVDRSTAGGRRSAATLPGYHAGRPPGNNGLR
jgi:hypothetical protein